MIINRETANGSYSANEGLMSKGSLIEPLSGSMLSRLVAAAMTDVAGSVRSTNNTQYNTKFDSLSDACIEQVVKGIQSEVDTARNVFNPIVKQIHEQYTIDNAEVNLNLFTPDVIINRLPAVCDVSLFRDYLEQFTSEQVSTGFPGTELKGAFPEAINLDFLYSAFKLPLSSAQEKLEEFVKTVSSVDLLKVYTKLFIEDSSNFLDSVTIAEATIGFFLTRLFISELPEGTTGSSSRINNVLTGSRARLASGLKVLLDRRSAAISRGELVISYEVDRTSQRHTVVVYGENYLGRYLQEGGSPESLLGGLINSPNNRSTINVLTTPENLKLAHRSYKINRDASLRELKGRKLEITRNHLYRSIDVVFKDIEEGTNESQQALLGKRTEAVTAVNNFVADHKLLNTDDISNYLITLLGNCLVDCKQYAICLHKVNNMVKEDPETDAKQAATIYTIERTTDWWLQQIVKTSKNQ